MKRVITITMDIDEAKHTAVVTNKITENGKPKKKWDVVQAQSTAIALIGVAKYMLTDANEYMLARYDKMKEENQ